MSPWAGLALVASLVASLGCARSSAPPRTQSAAAEAPPPDGGLPVPPPSSKKGLMVPSDVGLGAGTSGSTPTSGAISPVSPPVGGPPSVGN
jgi:hypothetical protein